MFCLVFMELVAFPERKDGIFEHIELIDDIIATSSGSIGLYKDGKCTLTSPNMTLGNDDKTTDWCSNIINKNENEDGKIKPWISYRIKNKRMRSKGYAMRSGCCFYGCCCIDDSDLIDSDCCCSLYSYSIQISDDNRTWKTIQSVEEDKEFWDCTNRVHEFDKVEEFTFIRLVLDKQRPYCRNCFALNKFEVYGETIRDNGQYYESEDDNDESVSIIGKINKNSQY